MAHVLVDKINRAYVEQHPERDDPFRRHLGGSLIGRKCERELYYIFRWFKRPTFDGRMLRLFNRGHREEGKFIDLLQSVGIEVSQYTERLMYHPESDTYLTVPDRAITTPPVSGDDEIEAKCDDVTGIEQHHKIAESRGIKPKQHRISDIMEHFGGSLDGEATAPFEIPLTDPLLGTIPIGEKFLTEFKTHNTKSFVNLVNVGLKAAKPEHWAQMQVYMLKRGLRFGVYMAVNKNDDDLHIEVIMIDPEAAADLVLKAQRIIHATQVPNRIAKHPSWHECKFCDFSDICHYGVQTSIDRNCRTCVNSTPVDGGRFHCRLYGMLIPVDAEIKGCDNHRVITD